MEALAQIAENPELQKAASQATQSAIGPWFWGSIWFPFASYGWTLGWILTAIAVGQTAGQDSKIKLFSKAQIASMLLMNFVWFFIVSIFISMTAVVVCHGGAGFLSSIGAWFARFAIKVSTLGQVNFDFCKSVPDITIYK